MYHRYPTTITTVSPLFKLDAIPGPPNASTNNYANSSNSSEILREIKGVKTIFNDHGNLRKILIKKNDMTDIEETQSPSKIKTTLHEEESNQNVYKSHIKHQ